MASVFRRAFPLLLLSLSAAAVRAAPPPPDFESLLRRTLQTCDGTADYTCLFHRRERIGKSLVEQRNIRAKFRKEPLAVLMAWTEGKMKGTESLYVPSLHGDKVRAHAGGLVSWLTLSLSPDGSLAMKENRHTIREFGIVYLAGRIAADAKKSRETGEGAVVYRGEEQRSGGPAWVYEGRFPDGKGFYCPRVVVSFDEATALPVKMAAYDAGDVLLEEYVFEDLRLNAGLTPEDFLFRRRRGPPVPGRPPPG